MTELMARVSQGDGFGSVHHALAGEHFQTHRAGEPIRIEAKLHGQVAVDANEPGRRHRGGLDAREKPVRKAGVTVVE